MQLIQDGEQIQVKTATIFLMIYFFYLIRMSYLYQSRDIISPQPLLFLGV